MLEYAKDHFGEDTLWTFQQDGATSHTTNITQNWFRDHIPKKYGLHAPCSHLNPMDFLVWSNLKSKACKKIHHTVDDLKRSLH